MAGRESSCDHPLSSSDSDLSEDLIEATPPRSTDTGDSDEKDKVKISRSDTSQVSHCSKSGSESTPVKSKPMCKYGLKCYRKNPSHFEQFNHPTGKKRKSSDTDGPVTKRPATEQTSETSKDDTDPGLRFCGHYFTKVEGISEQFNSQKLAKSLKDLLSDDMGDLLSSCHFNFMFEIPWLMEQYPREKRSTPILLVHGDQREAKNQLQLQASDFDNISLCQARLPIPFGTHHTKMMLLEYSAGMRVIIHTANLIERDWSQKTQSMWMSPLLPRSDDSSESSDSMTHFRRDLISYINSYGARALDKWVIKLNRHDFSSCRVFLVGSVPGRHAGSAKSQWGHLKLRKLLQSNLHCDVTPDWPVIGQFSSVGSLGPTPDQWLTSEFLASLGANAKAAMMRKPTLRLVFPSVECIRCSLEGYPGGGSVPYSVKTAGKQRYLHSYMHQWVSERLGRSRAVPHIKSYTRISPDCCKYSWLVVTSANLSKAAWGVLEKSDSQLMIRSYELGVLFIPQLLTDSDTFTYSDDVFENSSEPRLPFDLPLTDYQKKDRAWFVDAPCMDKPDTHGRVWCPAPL